MGAGAQAPDGGPGASGTRDPVPLVRVTPDYPTTARAEGIEGVCTVHYDMLADGSVDPDAVVALCTDEIFTEPASRAAARWTFAPALADGEPAERTGFRSQVRFALADE
jgi:protein TonB